MIAFAVPIDSLGTSAISLLLNHLPIMNNKTLRLRGSVFAGNSGDRYVDLDDPSFKKTLRADFLWSIPGNEK